LPGLILGLLGFRALKVILEDQLAALFGGNDGGEGNQRKQKQEMFHGVGAH